MLNKYKNMSIKFQRMQNSIKNKDTLELINEFYDFLQGELPEEMRINNIPKLNKEQSFAIIYYLQEHLPIFPDTIEKCDICGELFDISNSGNHCDICGTHCSGCDNCDCDV